MNGWLRIWVVISVLLGLCIGAVAFVARPTRAAVYESWCSAGIDAVAPTLKAHQDAMDTLLASFDFGNQIRNKGTKACTERLQHIQIVQANAAAASALAPVNAKYLQQYAQFSTHVAGFWLAVLAVWLACCALLWLLGWSVAWIRQGFAKPAT